MSVKKSQGPAVKFVKIQRAASSANVLKAMKSPVMVAPAKRKTVSFD